MSAHAFEVLSRVRNEIEVCHTAEGHRFKFFVITNAHGKRILSELVRLVSEVGAAHTPEFFSGSARALAITVAHQRLAMPIRNDSLPRIIATQSNPVLLLTEVSLLQTSRHLAS